MSSGPRFLPATGAEVREVVFDDDGLSVPERRNP